MTRQTGKLIIPFGEGEGEETALPTLLRRLIRATPTHSQSDQNIFVAAKAWRVGHLQKLLKDKGVFWRAQLAKAQRKGAAAVLLVLDGDRPANMGKPPHCVGTVASQLASYARETGAGESFSVAVVLARQEMESWFIAGAESLKQVEFDGRPLLNSSSSPPPEDLECQLRDAKGWLGRNMARGYKPTLDQVRLAQAVDFDQIRQRQMRSFQRLEHATAELCHAIKMDRPICSPVSRQVGGQSCG